MNQTQYDIGLNAHEQNGIWELIMDVSQNQKVDWEKALTLIQAEIDFLKNSDEFYLIKSDELYDESTMKILDKDVLLTLTLEDAKFNPDGPFYYITNFKGL